MIPKFRAWDKKKKKFIRLSALHIEESGENVGLVYDVSEHYISTAFSVGGGRSLNLIDGVLMQSTGLKDKNGVETFEGDILKIIEVTNEGISEYITDVIWEDCSFVFKSEGVDYYDSFLGAFSGDPNKTYPLFELLVIGNIHENPELLEVAE
ncbi:TPA: DNA-packaging protein [Enterococcus faecalis]|nr:DNA-packaging protein [Enterococcus faecalis]